MNRVIGVLKNQWLLSVIGTLAICILVWFIGPLVAIAQKVPLASETSRLLVILFCVVLWGLNNLRVRHRVSKANKAMAGDLSASSAVEDPMSVQSETEVEILRERFSEALDVYRQSTGKRGKANLYELPWYIIIGPPGSGKTTALANSGLNFPLADRFGKKALRGVGGTRNCDWLFTNEAVFIDTAGRYTTQDSHRDVDASAWKGFLDLLVKYRKRRPINGAIIAISLADLLMQSSAERDQQIRAIRQRLQELDKNLGIQFPVYVMFTKCDLIAGFSEYFDDLDAQESQQIWGMTFPFNPDARSSLVTEQFISEFDALTERLNERLMQRVMQERDPARRVKLFSFPQQVAALRQQLNDFLIQAFSADRFNAPIMVRGVYFSSATQEGSPIDRVLGALSRRFGLNRQTMNNKMGRVRSYFLNRLLSDVVLEESELVGANSKLEKRRTWLQRASYTVTIAVISVFVLLWATSFTRNEVYIYKFNQALSDYQRVVAQQSSTTLANFDYVLERLNGAENVTQVYEQYRDGAPWLMGFGLYQGDKLATVADDLYRAELTNLLLPAVQLRMEHNLQDNRIETDLRYETLKAYLMLADETRRDSALIQLWMELDWQSMYPSQPAVQGQFQNHLARMLQLGFPPPELNSEIVAESRAYLRMLPLSELQYGRLKRDYIATDSSPFQLQTAMGPKRDAVFARPNQQPINQSHSSLFTYEGYHKYFKKQVREISQLASAENWVLDGTRKALTKPEIERLQNDINALYFADYINVWERLLASVDVRKFNNATQAAEVLGNFAAPLSPLRNFLNAVSSNTQLAGSGLMDKLGEKAKAAESGNRLTRLLGSAADKVEIAAPPEQVVDDHFESLHAVVAASETGPVPLDQVLANVTQLYGQFDALGMGMGSDYLTMAKGSTTTELLGRIQLEASRQPQPLQRWLKQLTTNSNEIVLAGAHRQINDLWQANVLPLCNRSVEGRYPFVPGSTQEISLVDFGQLFGDSGLFHRFFQDNLRPFVAISGERWRWKPVAGQTIGISNSALAQFKRADQIRKLYFQSGGSTPSVNFSLKPVYLDANVKSVYLDFEGQAFEYQHGPIRSQRAQWPGPNNPSAVRLEFEDDSGARLVESYHGPWAMFRLFDQSMLTMLSSDVVQATFTLRSRKSTWEIRADSVMNPIKVGLIKDFQCPQRL